MGNTPHDDPRGSDVLALGFGTTTAMWAVGYVGRLPGVQAPSPCCSPSCSSCSSPEAGPPPD